MKKYFVGITLMALWVAPALGQAPVFFDDFDGNALAPHWFQPPPSAWEYNVSNSMLNVTGLFSPSNPKSPSNFASMTALFAPQSNFRMDVWMGWEAGQQPHRLEIWVGGPFGGSPIIARMGYRFEESDPYPLIFGGAGGGGPPQTIPAPAPGIHHFTIARTGNQFSFIFNGSLLAGYQDNFGTPAAGVTFSFLGPYPGQLGAFHIDRVQVVPAPGTLLFLSATLSIGCRMRRRR